MKKLYLVRHAKSSWKEEGITDFDRPLKGRGIRDAHTTAQWLQKQEEAPELMISSPATRAMHTALIFAQELQYPFSDIHIEANLYHGDRDDILQALAKLDNSIHQKFFIWNRILSQYTDLRDITLDHLSDILVRKIFTSWSSDGQDEVDTIMKSFNFPSAKYIIGKVQYEHVVTSKVLQKAEVNLLFSLVFGKYVRSLSIESTRITNKFFR